MIGRGRGRGSERWRRLKEKERENMDRDWQSLPSTALVQIFKSLNLEERLLDVPLVCRAWNHASKDPRCWESMLPLEHSLEDCFIKYPNHTFQSGGFHYIATQQLQGIIERADGRATTLFLSAVHPESDGCGILAFVADRCPHLKHLSLRGFDEKSQEGFLELMNKCNELELLDLGDCFSFPATTIEEMGRCWPHLRGLSWSGNIDHIGASAIATSFTELRWLNLSGSTLAEQGLRAILDGCGALRFLDVTDCKNLKVDRDIIERSARIRDFLFGETCEELDLCYHYDDDQEGYDTDRWDHYGETDDGYDEREPYWSCCGNPWSGGERCNSCEDGGTMLMLWKDDRVEERTWPWWL